MSGMKFCFACQQSISFPKTGGRLKNIDIQNKVYGYDTECVVHHEGLRDQLLATKEYHIGLLKSPELHLRLDHYNDVAWPPS